MGVPDADVDNLVLKSEQEAHIFSESRGQWKAATQSQEFFTSLQRYYNNTYVDPEKQDAINVFLGHFRPCQGKPALWEMDSDQHYSIGRQSFTLSDESSRNFPVLRATGVIVLLLFVVICLFLGFFKTQIIRYSFFGTKEALGSAPSWLLWLRYSTFMLLYLTGITSEVGLIYVALPYIKEAGKYCIGLPNTWNFSFDYFYAGILVLGIYVPGSPHMYTYMLGQRKKALSKSKRE